MQFAIQPSHAYLAKKKNNVFLEKNNGRMFLLELRNPLFAKLNPFYVNPVAGKEAPRQRP